MQTTNGGRQLAVALVATTLLCGCAAVSMETTPTGDSALTHNGVTFQVPTGGLRVLESHAGRWILDPHLTAEDGASGVTLKATIKNAEVGDCREKIFAKLNDIPGFEAKTVSRETRGQFSVIEYTAMESPDPRFGTTQLPQRNAVGCATVGDATAVMHLSKVKYTEADEKTFERLFDQARVTGQ